MKNITVTLCLTYLMLKSQTEHILTSVKKIKLR